MDIVLMCTYKPADGGQRRVTTNFQPEGAGGITDQQGKGPEGGLMGIGLPVRREKLEAPRNSFAEKKRNR